MVLILTFIINVITLLTLVLIQFLYVTLIIGVKLRRMNLVYFYKYSILIGKN